MGKATKKIGIKEDKRVDKKIVNKNAPKVPKKVKKYNGGVVTPVLYDGPFGKYMAAQVNGKTVLSESGRPLEFKYVGEWA